MQLSPGAPSRTRHLMTCCELRYQPAMNSETDPPHWQVCATFDAARLTIYICSGKKRKPQNAEITGRFCNTTPDFYPIPVLSLVAAFSLSPNNPPFYGNFPFNIVRGEIVLDDPALGYRSLGTGGISDPPAANHQKR